MNPPNERAVVAELADWLRPDTTKDATRDPAVGWPALLDCAAAHQLLPALWSSLRRAGVRPLPPVLRDRAGASSFAVLEDAYAANASRVADLEEQGRDVLDAFRRANVPVMPIKGLHALLAGWWADPAARVMVDIDLLVPEARIRDAALVVASCGYRDLGTRDPEGLAAHQRPAVGRPGRQGSLELHTAPLVVRHAAILSTDELFAAADELTVDGLAVVVPNPTHAMTLAIAHAQLQDDDARLLQLPLRALTDVAALVARGVADPVDWDAVRACFARQHATHALAGFAVALEELFGMSLPVPTKGGRSWWSATWWATGHPRAARSYREVVTVPRALSSSRMERLYDAHTPSARTVARARHVTAGVQRRLRRATREPATPEPATTEPVASIAVGMFMITTPLRADVRRDTLANLAATDWGAEPVLVVDEQQSPDFHVRIRHTARRLLAAAIVGPTDLFVFLEDDLDFNRSLRHNLERWPPLIAHVEGAHFFGSLYNPNLVPLDADRPATFWPVPLDEAYGTQAWILSRATARLVLEQWDSVTGYPDIVISRLAGRVTPLWYHLPSLVQHRPVPSVWGGVAHEAFDYEPEWRAPDPEPRSA